MVGASEGGATNVAAGVGVPADEPARFTTTEIARRLGRPASTVRYWRNSYRDQLEEAVDAEGHPIYQIEPFRVIDAMLRRRAPRSEIRAALGAGVAETEDEWRQDTTERLQRIESALERLVSLVTERNDADDDVPQ